MFRLIISEKPSVSASIAYCIGATEKISEGETFYWQGNGYIVTNALGHLFGIGMPEDYGWESWELDTLPLIPNEFKLLPLNGYGGQIKLLKKLISRDDVTEIINACDAGREGECIFRYIYNYFGCTKPTKRLWISSLTDESIKLGMKNLLDGKGKNNLFVAGFTRAKADWILGMSLSRLYSIVNDDSHKVGRVKTPVLNIVANRDEAIAAFTKRPFYKVVLENGAECENVFDTGGKRESKMQRQDCRCIFIKDRAEKGKPSLASQPDFFTTGGKRCVWNDSRRYVKGGTEPLRKEAPYIPPY